MALELDSLSKSVEVLRRSLQVVEVNESRADDDMLYTLRSGVIQNFEVAYEQCWKMMKRWLDNNLGSAYVDGVTRRELFRLAAEHQLIENVDRWMAYHYARNETPHTYDGESANVVYDSAKTFLQDALKFLSRIRSRND